MIYYSVSNRCLFCAHGHVAIGGNARGRGFSAPDAPAGHSHGPFPSLYTTAFVVLPETMRYLWQNSSRSPTSPASCQSPALPPAHQPTLARVAQHLPLRIDSCPSAPSPQPSLSSSLPAPSCSCRVLGSTGASAESVMVACGCTACARRPPNALMSDGGRVASLADWAAHAGLEGGSLDQLAVRQPGADSTVRKRGAGVRPSSHPCQGATPCAVHNGAVV